MGGKALAHLGVTRKSREEHLSICSEAVAILRRYFTHVSPTADIPWKQDFGDVDILVAGSIERFNPVEAVPESRGCVSNGCVLSFELRGEQVDVIHVREDSFTFARFYHHTYVGALLGTVLTRAGYKLGHDGLWLRREGMKAFHLSCDLEAVLDFFGMAHPPEKFATKNDAFEYVASCRIDARCILSRTENSDQRRSASRIPMISQFDAWLEERWTDDLRLPDSHTESQKCISRFGKSEEWAAFWARENKARMNKLRLNGALASEVTGLTGKKLGILMAAFRKKYDEDAVFVMSSDYIRAELSRLAAELTHE
jgi:hypothetical protein